ncbi:MAG: SIMPL domain-containing protein [Erysipelotrichaceae bacterium]|nr:SIMPL domain-containing protein [Erysipelotrichaceae bacterium]
MSVIKVKGIAKRKVLADITNIEIKFYSEDIKTSRATDKNNEQCERFLQRFKELGVAPSFIHLSEDKIVSNYSKSDLKTVSRTISFEIPFDARINNAILKIIKEEDLTVFIETEFVIGNRKQIHKELLQEAFIDSKTKAELIASANNQTVKYIETVSDSWKDIYDVDKESTHLCGSIDGLYLEDDSLSAQLSAKYLEELETVFVSWVIE